MDQSVHAHRVPKNKLALHLQKFHLLALLRFLVLRERIDNEMLTEVLIQPRPLLYEDEHIEREAMGTGKLIPSRSPIHEVEYIE